MTRKKLGSIHSVQDRPAVPALKPYQPPRILSRETLESAANVCTGFGMKAQPGQPAPGGGLCGQSGLFS